MGHVDIILPSGGISKQWLSRFSKQFLKGELSEKLG
jgi:hypothetical protein